MAKTSKMISRRRFLAVSAAGVGSALLAACGASSSAPAGEAGSTSAPAASSGQVAEIVWSSWGNPGETKRLQEFTDDFNSRHSDIKATFRPVDSGTYGQKLVTEFVGGTAPDAPYVEDTQIAKLVQDKQIMELSDLLSGPNSKSKPDEFAEGLWGAAKTADGKIYGVTVDCNPLVFWYNKKVLQEAGVTDDPADLYEAGNWNWNTFQNILDKITASGKRGFVLGSWWAPIWSWVTTNGGKVYEGDKFVGHEDPKSIEAFQFLYDNIQSKNIIYTGSLPKGQGEDALFISNQLGFGTAGRWWLPQMKQVPNLEYDVVPWPTNTGKKLEPAAIATAYMALNAATKNVDASFTFLTEFVSKEGQTFRLQGGGNAVPSVGGVDNLVLDGNLPAHAQYFLDTRDVGYANFSVEAGTPGVSKDVSDTLEPLWLKGGDVASTLKQIADTINPKIAAGGAS